ncbi:uncharacterized protein [Palaemon carinicauda]|uniref:uncharacterized protein n=1 Tax=Palaemon carinicauda TaxID=392227 RepID=UPI0035B58786
MSVELDSLHSNEEGENKKGLCGHKKNECRWVLGVCFGCGETGYHISERKKEKGVKCSRCGMTGHTASGCRSNSTNVICGNCGKYGPYARMCWEKHAKCSECGVDGHIAKRPRHFSPPIAREIEEQCQELERMGVKERSESAWNSPIFPVRKPDGTLRMFIDDRKVSEVTVKERFPVNVVAECVYKMHGMKVFTKLDSVRGYYQMPLAEGRRPITAFLSSNCYFQFKRLSFGLANASAAFQRVMNVVLAGFDRQKVTVFIDDISIASETVEEHMQLLDAVLRWLIELGVKVNLEKYWWLARELEFLGHVVHESSIRKSEEFVNKVREFPHPGTEHELLGFLALVEFGCNFVRDYTDRGKPLNERTDEALIAYDTLEINLLEQYPPSSAACLAKLSQLSQQPFGDQKTSLNLRELTSITRLQPAADVSPREVNLLCTLWPLTDAHTTINDLHSHLLMSMPQPTTSSTTYCSPSATVMLLPLQEMSEQLSVGKKLVSRPSLEVVASLFPNLFLLHNAGTGIHFSLLPRTLSRARHRQSRSANVRVVSINGSVIPIHGYKAFTLFFGSTKYHRKFLLADVTLSILSADFPSHFPLLVDIAHRLVARNVNEWAHTCTICQASKVYRRTESGAGTFTQPQRHFAHILVNVVYLLPTSQGQCYLSTVIDQATYCPEAIPMQTATSTSCTVKSKCPVISGPPLSPPISIDS